MAQSQGLGGSSVDIYDGAAVTCFRMDGERSEWTGAVYSKC